MANGQDPFGQAIGGITQGIQLAQRSEQIAQQRDALEQRKKQVQLQQNEGLFKAIVDHANLPSAAKAANFKRIQMLSQSNPMADLDEVTTRLLTADENAEDAQKILGNLLTNPNLNEDERLAATNELLSKMSTAPPEEVQRNLKLLSGQAKQQRAQQAARQVVTASTRKRVVEQLDSAEQEAGSLQIKQRQNTRTLLNAVVSSRDRPNPSLDLAITKNFIRGLEASGRLTDQDLDDARSTRSTIEGFKQLIKEFQEGDTLTPEQREEMAQVAIIAQRSADKRFTGKVRQTRAEALQSGFDEQAFNQLLTETQRAANETGVSIEPSLLGEFPVIGEALAGRRERTGKPQQQATNRRIEVLKKQALKAGFTQEQLDAKIQEIRNRATAQRAPQAVQQLPQQTPFSPERPAGAPSFIQQTVEEQ